MKRLILFLTLLICAVSLAGVIFQAKTQESLRPQLGDRDDLTKQIISPDSLPQSYLNQNRTHKLILNENDSATYNELVRKNAVREEFDYGSFKLVIVDEGNTGGRDTLQSLPVVAHDEQNMIALSGY